MNVNLQVIVEPEYAEQSFERNIQKTNFSQTTIWLQTTGDAGYRTEHLSQVEIRWKQIQLLELQKDYKPDL